MGIMCVKEASADSPLCEGTSSFFVTAIAIVSIALRLAEDKQAIINFFPWHVQFIF